MSRIGRNPITVPDARDRRRRPTASSTVDGPQRHDEPRRCPTGITRRARTATCSSSSAPRRRDASTEALHGLTRTLVANMVTGRDRGLVQGARDRRRRLPRRQAPGPAALDLALGFSHPVKFTAPEGITFEVPVAHARHRQGRRQGGRRPGRRVPPQAPQARALQGQGRALPRRARRAQGRKGSRSNGTLHRASCASAGTSASAVKLAGHGRATARRGQPLQQAHLGPDHRRRRRAAPWPPRRRSRPACAGRAGTPTASRAKVGAELLAERAKAARHHRGGLRPRRVRLPRPRRRVRRRAARRRTGVLMAESSSSRSAPSRSTASRRSSRAAGASRSPRSW